DLVLGVVEGGEHEYRRWHFRLAKPAADLAPAETGQHDVEDQHVVVLGLCPVQAIDAILRCRNRVSFRLEPAENEPPDSFIVLDQQQVHQAAALSVVVSGKCRVATVPPPAFGESSVRPPCACTSAWTRLRPSPAPSPRVSPRRKRSNRQFARAKSRPGPLSVTEIATPSMPAVASMVT